MDIGTAMLTLRVCLVQPTDACTQLNFWLEVCLKGLGQVTESSKVMMKCGALIVSTGPEQAILHMSS